MSSSLYVEFGFAQKYVDDLSKDVKLGLGIRIERGWYPGVAPMGHLNCLGRMTGENKLIKDPDPLVFHEGIIPTGCLTRRSLRKWN